MTERTLTDEDLKRIGELIRGHCPMTPEEVSTLKGMASVVRELGNGDLYTGGIVFRRQAEFVGKILSKKNLIIGLFIVASVGALVTNGVEAIISWFGGR